MKKFKPNKDRLQQRTLDSYFGRPSVNKSSQGVGWRSGGSGGIPAPSVLLPWSDRHRYTLPDSVSLANATLWWPRTEQLLHQVQGIVTVADLIPLMCQLRCTTETAAGDATFGQLVQTLTRMEEAERRLFLADVLPWMSQLLLAAPALFRHRSIPLLTQGSTQQLVLSHQEAVTLLACAFFSLFPEDASVQRKKTQRRQGTQSRLLPGVNLFPLLQSYGPHRSSAMNAKIRCIIEYFLCCYRHSRDPQSPAHRRCVELVRVFNAEVVDWAACRTPLQPVELRSTGVIEGDTDTLQVDFANRMVGGGVLRTGCVQEEIRMALSPEMLLALLVTEQLGADEVLYMSGTPMFSETTGYGDSFRFARGVDPWAVAVDNNTEGGPIPPPPLVPTPFVHSVTGQTMQMHRVCVVAMDAYPFGARQNLLQQTRLPPLHRELQKALVAFKGTSEEVALLPLVRSGPIATGHWGCGAFGGHVELKLLLQWIAASVAGRPLHYYTFDKPLADFPTVGKHLAERGVTAGGLYTMLRRYGDYCERAEVPLAQSVEEPSLSMMTPFQFILQQRQ